MPDVRTAEFDIFRIEVHYRYRNVPVVNRKRI